MSAEQLAEGIIEIANWNQSNAIRQMTIQRGIDPREFALLSFGGSGPAQSPAVMDLIGMKACIVPPNPGNLSAFGLLAVDWRTDHIVTKVMHEDAIDLAAVADIYAGLEADAAATLERDGIEPSRIRLVREADVRYAGQSMEVRVPAPSRCGRRLRSSTVWSLRSTPPISRPSATTTPASRRWSWSISACPVSA